MVILELTVNMVSHFKFYTCAYTTVCYTLFELHENTQRKRLFTYTFVVVVELFGFYAATTSPAVSSNPFPYTTLELDTALGFNNVSANTYNCRQAGIYWIFMTAVWDGLTWAEFDLNGLDSTYPQPSVFRQHTVFNNFDIISRDFIRSLNQSQVLSTQTMYPTWANNMTGTSWGAFQIDNIMSPVVSHMYMHLSNRYFEQDASEMLKCSSLLSLII